ncbi:CPBP family glutamic-type intramembrane protease, partial [Mycobacterium kansasii]
FSGVQASWPWAVAVLALVVFVGPLGEEIRFRGLLWGAVDRRWGRWAALGVTTVVFALAHLELTRAPLLVVVAIPIALARL